MKLVFMGTPRAAATSLELLLDRGHDIAAVYTQPDRPAGRGKHIAFSPVKDLALANDIPVEQPLKVRTPEAFQRFSQYQADAAVVVAYGRILPRSFLTTFKYGAINVHFSLLPRYRGAAPVNWVIVNGEIETGVTTMKMDEGLDTGDILLQETTPIDSIENSIDLMDRLAFLGADLLIETLDSLDSLEPKPQDHNHATSAPILKKEDGVCNFSMPAVAIANRIRGFQPFPGVFTHYKGNKLTLWSASAGSNTGHVSPAGTIVSLDDCIRVACGDGSVLAISELQLEGKRRLSARDFLNGTRLAVGDRLGER